MFTIFGKASAADAARNRARERSLHGTRSGADGSRLRSTERTHDRALSRVASAWMLKLPINVRPLKTAESYPHVLNRLALCWNDPLLVERLYDELMVDRRGKRRGFPPAVARELLALRQCMATVHPAEERTYRWDSRLQVPSDR
jgi:hypothetical protein